MHPGRRMKPSSGVFRIIGAPTASRDDYYYIVHNDTSYMGTDSTEYN